MPPEVDVKTFVLTGGKVAKRPELVAGPLHEAPKPAIIGAVYDTHVEHGLRDRRKRTRFAPK
jgi:hypothetical protein